MERQEALEPQVTGNTAEREMQHSCFLRFTVFLFVYAQLLPEFPNWVTSKLNSINAHSTALGSLMPVKSTLVSNTRSSLS